MPKWYILGLQLGVSADERNYPRDNHICKVKMFGAWLRVDTSASYRKLAKALAAVGKRNIAEAMCTASGMSQHWNVHLCTTSIVCTVLWGLG